MNQPPLTNEALSAALAELETSLQPGSADTQTLVKAAMRVANELRGMRDDDPRLTVALERVAAAFRRASGDE